MARPTRKVTAAEKLQTLDLYLRFQNSNRVADMLGIEGATVRSRLRGLGITLRPSGWSGVPVEQVNDMRCVATIREELEAQVERENVIPVREEHPGAVPASELLETLEAYLELQRIAGVAERLHIAKTTVHNRLLSLGVNPRPRGRSQARVQEVNDVAAIAATILRLKAQIAAHPPGG